MPLEIRSALGLAGSMSSGLFAYLGDGSETKPVHAGWAAHGGILAAELAAAGGEGPAAVFEDRFGFFAAYYDGDAVALAAEVSGPGPSLGDAADRLQAVPGVPLRAQLPRRRGGACAPGIPWQRTTSSASPSQCPIRVSRSCSSRATPSATRAPSTTQSSACSTRSLRCSCTAASASRPTPSRPSATRRCSQLGSPCRARAAGVPDVPAVVPGLGADRDTRRSRARARARAPARRAREPAVRRRGDGEVPGERRPRPRRRVDRRAPGGAALARRAGRPDATSSRRSARRFLLCSSGDARAPVPPARRSARSSCPAASSRRRTRRRWCTTTCRPTTSSPTRRRARAAASG